MQTLPLSVVKAHFSEIADEVDRTHDRVHITRNGREYVVLISAADLASMEATLELLGDPAAVQRLRDAETDVAAGGAVPASEMEDLMAERRARGR